MARIRATASRSGSADQVAADGGGGGDRKRRRTSTNASSSKKDGEDANSEEKEMKKKKKKKKETLTAAAELPAEHATLLRDYDQLDAVCCLLLKRKLRCSLNLIFSMVRKDKDINIYIYVYSGVLIYNGRSTAPIAIYADVRANLMMSSLSTTGSELDRIEIEATGDCCSCSGCAGMVRHCNLPGEARRVRNVHTCSVGKVRGQVPAAVWRCNSSIL